MSRQPTCELNRSPAASWPIAPLISSSVLCSVIIALWGLPAFWYTKSSTVEAQKWLRENDQVEGWEFNPIPVSEAAEAELAADRVFNGEFRRSDGTTIRAFAAHDFTDRGTAAMFAHTPDRCWTASGWTLVPVVPETIRVKVHGLNLDLERRLFVMGSHRELVYFGALVGGRSLPKRLDQYYELGLRQTDGLGGRHFIRTLLGSLSTRFLSWPWRVFASRVPLTGAKQFIRISTPVVAAEVSTADELLKGFLARWLLPPPGVVMGGDGQDGGPDLCLNAF
jgi:hypothetical protein